MLGFIIGFVIFLICVAIIYFMGKWFNHYTGEDAPAFLVGLILTVILGFIIAIISMLTSIIYIIGHMTLELFH